MAFLDFVVIASHLLLNDLDILDLVSRKLDRLSLFQSCIADKYNLSSVSDADREFPAPG